MYKSYIKLKLPGLRAAFRYVTVNHPLILTSPGRWATLGNWHSGLPGFVCNEQEYKNLSGY